jgi:hypothetical protein
LAILQIGNNQQRLKAIQRHHPSTWFLWLKKIGVFAKSICTSPCAMSGDSSGCRVQTATWRKESRQSKVVQLTEINENCRYSTGSGLHASCMERERKKICVLVVSHKGHKGQAISRKQPSQRK